MSYNRIVGCSLGTCPLSYAYVEYVPTLAGNTTYLALFGCLLASQVFLGIRYRTWTFLGTMAAGILLEILGYVGRIMLHSNPFDFNAFLLYLICLTIGPAFLSAAIYLCLGRIVVTFGTSMSRLTPRSYTILFVNCDLVSLVLQAVGGALTATAATKDASDTGVDIMIAGLGFQVFSLSIFMFVCIDFAWRVKRRDPMAREMQFVELRKTWQFKGFLCALVIATITIFIRCVYRVVELSGGFSGALANNEPVFMVFEGPMIIIAVAVLSLFQPGAAFQQQWKVAAFPMISKSKKRVSTIDSE